MKTMSGFSLQSTNKRHCISPTPNSISAVPNSISAVHPIPLFNAPSTPDVILTVHSPDPSISPVHPTPLFNDPSTSDVILTVHSPDPSISPVHLHLHSHILLHYSNYFSTLLSPRWQLNENNNNQKKEIKLTVSNLNTYTTVLTLLYTRDFATVIDSVTTAVLILHVALEILFEDCVKYCIKFLEAVPWTEHEETQVIELVPFLNDEESGELLARVGKKNGEGSSTAEEMLNGLIKTATCNGPNVAFAKAFVAKLLRDFSSRESARRVLDRAFTSSLKVVREAMEEYSSPDFRGDHNETEAIQRLNLHTAMMNGKNLLWLVERMIELRVADLAVEEWSKQAALTADLQRAFRDDAWRNLVPGLPSVVLKCTCKLANAVAGGIVLPCRQIRMKLVKDWLPVLIVCKDNISPMVSSHKSFYSELEETFLKIISTLPMSDAQDLLQQCLSFSTRNADDCPHLITAFNTWFRRANRHLDNSDMEANSSSENQA